MSRVRVLGVPIDPLTKRELLDRLAATIAAKLPSQVVTVNPEFLIAAGRDREFRQSLTTAEFSVADGIGIRAAATYQTRWLPAWQPARLIVSLFQGISTGLTVFLAPRLLAHPIPETITGVDLVDDLATIGAREGWRFYFAGGIPGRAAAAAQTLAARYPGLTIVGAEDGPPDPRYRSEPFEAYLEPFLARIRSANPDILLIAFGAPKQDLFIAEHKAALGVPVMIGVGGTFDFLAGAVQRAPGWLRTLGLEWLWRLFIEPWRWRRILTAVIIFPWHVFLARQRVTQ
ncbi:WecB/TagA/CpsF family glycosyltransferase [Candidatus Berkelbacteria bacterium]|nr:WecB/TagA/CpsF family glycosyltransferase [Candidatus Berkelbacteria bacterium]